MAGTIVESELTATTSSGVRFVQATETDDAAIRRLLRENPIRGAISVSFEREPDYFRGIGIGGADDQVILAFDQKRLACLGRCSVRNGWLNGEARRIGYLSELRLAGDARGRFDILRRGYQFFHQRQQENPADIYFTSITVDNARSLRFLERGLPGMPKYEPLGDFVTLFIPVPRRGPGPSKNIVSASRERLSELIEFLNAQAGWHNLATVWDEQMILALARHGLSLPDFQLWLDDEKIVGCAALWDQRGFKQTVIRGYDRRLSMARPLMDVASRWFGTPTLPSIGSPLAYAFVSPLVTALDAGDHVDQLVSAALASAAGRGLKFVALGFSAEDARLALVRKRFRCREYRNRLFQVRWDDLPSIDLDGRILFPEVALL